MKSMVAYILLAFASATASALHLQKRDDGSFLSPGTPQNIPDDFSENPEWPLESVQDVRWQWSERYKLFKIFLEYSNVYEGSPEGGVWAEDLLIYERYANEPDPGHFGWPVTTKKLDLDTLDTLVFRLTMKANDSSTRHFESRTFNITQAQPKTPSATSSSSSKPTATVTETVTARPVPHHMDARALALGLVLGLGFPLLFLLGAFIGLFISTFR